MNNKIAHYTQSELKRFSLPMNDSYPSDFLRLDRLESPYSLPLNINDLELININKYPDDSPDHLKKIICDIERSTTETAVLLGNGASELIQMLITAVQKPGGSILSPAPSFMLYRFMAELYGIKYIGVELNDEFNIDKESFLSAIEQHQPALVFICYPNNPTANLFDFATIVEIIEQSPGIVVIDEAYYFFAGQSLVHLLERYENLLILRSLSKVGLAGIRFGYLLGQTKLVSRVDVMRPLFNLNALTQSCAYHAFTHYDELLTIAGTIILERERIIKLLNTIPGIIANPSHTNFILLKTLGPQSIDWLREQLLLHKIVVSRTNVYPISDAYLRVTVGTNKMNDRLIDTMRQILS